MTTTTQNYVEDIVTIDYIRLATFDFKVYCDLSAKIRQKYAGWRKSRFLQYTMQRSQDGVSYGLAEQNGRQHGLFEASGITAHTFAHWIASLPEFCDAMYCTRIDFQSTKTRHPDLDYVQTWKRVKKPKNLILGDDGNTLYIGNRESDSFWRIYDKSETHTRCEVELKGNQAKRAWLTLLGNEDVASIYCYYLQKSRVPKYLAEYYQNSRQPMPGENLATIADIDVETTFLWLASLDRLVYKLANDHTVGERTAQLISRWCEYVTKD